MKRILELMLNEARLISDKEFEATFDLCWNEMEYDFRKLEIESIYQCDIDENYEAFQKRDYEAILENFKEFKTYWTDKVSSKKLKVSKRLHLVDLPLNDYLKYEGYFYYINEGALEHIRYLEYKDIEETKEELIDYLIFDNKRVLFNKHDSKGNYLCSYLYEGALTEELIEEFDVLYEKGTDYKDYLQFDEKIIDILKIIEK